MDPTASHIPPPLDYTYEWALPLRRSRAWCTSEWELGDVSGDPVTEGVHIPLDWGYFDRPWADSEGPFRADRLQGGEFRDLDYLLEFYEDVAVDAGEEGVSWQEIVECWNDRWEPEEIWAPGALWAAYLDTLKDGWCGHC